MDILSKITPAETLLLKYGSSAELKDLMKYTFMDLLLKQVIKIDKVDRKVHPNDKYIRSYTYIVAGENLKKYKYNKHELIFLSPFLKSKSIQILFKNYFKMVFDLSKGSWSYKKLVRSSENIYPYFKSHFWAKLFRAIILTDKGALVRNDIVAYLNDLDRGIDKLMHDDKQKGLEVLLRIGGNVFLLKNLDFEFFKNIDKSFISHQKTLTNNSDDTYIYWWVYSDDDNFDNVFDLISGGFDDVLESFDSEFDANSCSSWDNDSSGCNSCDGCGGCD
ncbi:hypothetical protein [Algibacter sp. L3A6]|uniref:hypothetical protein n=1 Tax=Algibacter sp. L3A6 TaxID=2686366 RepID=UPI00131B6A79|nr:hypothetical protein [Algibacter sp. L3A6]